MKWKVNVSLLSIMIKTYCNENDDLNFVYEIENNSNNKLVDVVYLSQNLYDLIILDV